jgi:hypothetical protein
VVPHILAFCPNLHNSWGKCPSNRLGLKSKIFINKTAIGYITFHLVIGIQTQSKKNSGGEGTLFLELKEEVIADLST